MKLDDLEWLPYSRDGRWQYTRVTNRVMLARCTDPETIKMLDGGPYAFAVWGDNKATLMFFDPYFGKYFDALEATCLYYHLKDKPDEAD